MHAPEPGTDPARWSHDVVEETLGDGARRLTIDVTARLMAHWWDRYAEIVGVPRRRWLEHRPTNDGPLVRVVDGRAAFDLAAWIRFASLAPGAVALRSRTAAAFGVAPEQLDPPAPRPGRLLDLMRARRADRRMRRALRTIDADLARLDAHLQGKLVHAALASGDDGTPFELLPAYALASRLEQLIDDAGTCWRPAVLVDHACGAAIDDVLRMLQDDEAIAPGEIELELARRTTTGDGVRQPPHLEALDELAQSGDPHAGIDAWIARWGWHAMRDVPLEATPLRDQRDAVVAWLDTTIERHLAGGRGAPHLDEREERRGSALDPVSQRAREFVLRREQVGQLRATVHAALRGVVHTLAATLERSGAVEEPDAVFDLDLDQLLALARGAASEGPSAPQSAASGSPKLHEAQPAVDTPAARLAVGDTLQGQAAGPGRITARAEVVPAGTAPPPDLAVDGAVLVCRSTDPAWMPLLLRCAGVVTERGGPLSHAAIVARELGLPVVTSVAGITSRATNAMVLDVDGATGTVQRVR